MSSTCVCRLTTHVTHGLHFSLPFPTPGSPATSYLVGISVLSIPGPVATPSCAKKYFGTGARSPGGIVYTWFQQPRDSVMGSYKIVSQPYCVQHGGAYSIYLS
ncbi:unnamed protein product [Rhizoctonia solani]|uniref:Uncharacterized protein n=1 Tax=Rhizoctonia solani TaxID=456999 RepID=A0A8H3E4H9_9AGAM|nr:unnamed protein product [Rhizoctonia solani]